MSGHFADLALLAAAIATAGVCLVYKPLELQPSPRAKAAKAAPAAAPAPEPEPEPAAAVVEEMAEVEEDKTWEVMFGKVAVRQQPDVTSERLGIKLKCDPIASSTRSANQPPCRCPCSRCPTPTPPSPPPFLLHLSGASW